MASASIQPQRVLILDDQPNFAEIMAMSLRTGGFIAQGFTSPRLALEKIAEFDILVTDYHMPEMTGLEVAKEAYARGWRGSLLLMSGQRQALIEDDVHPLFRAAMQKPFSTADLMTVLRELKHI
jgi:two-component system, OmpR family, response regulator